MSPLGKFWNYVASVQSLFGWIVKGGLAVPLLPLLADLGPPWNAMSPVLAKGTVAILTAIVQILAMTSAFSYGKARSLAWRSSVQHRTFMAVIPALVIYVALLLLLTETTPKVSHRYVKGFLVTSDYHTVLAELGDPDKAKDALGRNPFRIWVAWTVYISQFLVTIGWLTFFGILAFYIAIFVEIVTDEHEADKMSIFELGLPESIRRDLEVAGVITIGDLVAKTRHELLKLPKIGESKVDTISRFLRNNGRHLRGEEE